uniref:Uncharacterized protein n=1 Tax=Cacopsylla melanoneura TaxID=428564 RepID=A0A8D9EZN3_9HEMI
MKYLHLPMILLGGQGTFWFYSFCTTKKSAKCLKNSNFVHLKKKKKKKRRLIVLSRLSGTRYTKPLWQIVCHHRVQNLMGIAINGCGSVYHAIPNIARNNNDELK